MTAAKAIATLRRVRSLTIDADLIAAIDVALPKLERKPRASKAKACPVAKAALSACSGIGILAPESRWKHERPSTCTRRAWYLDTFGAPGSPERVAQEKRLNSLPTHAQFDYAGMPEKLHKDPEAARLYLFGRIEEMERQDEAARLYARQQAIRERVKGERDVLQAWAVRNVAVQERALNSWQSGRPTAQWRRLADEPEQVAA